MLRIISISFIVLVVMSLSHVPTEAAYVLPYPSLMPGNRLYKVKRVFDDLNRYWHFGNLASYRYYLKRSDNALVEAKTLFEYHQYSLALAALDRSDVFFSQAPKFVRLARGEGKDVSPWSTQLGEAREEHIRLLEDLQRELPAEFLWRPEKADAHALKIHSALSQSIEVRKKAITL